MRRAWLIARYVMCFLFHPVTVRTRWGAYCPVCALRWN